MNELQVFRFETLAVRVVGRGDEPWWVAADVCEALNLANPRDAVSRLDDDEKGVATTDTPGGPQELTIISESGLYTLIMTSRKPEAKRFRKWVTSEVLPTVRKTGHYSVQPAEDSLVAQARLHLETVQRQVRLEKTQREQQRQIAALSLTSTHMTLMGWCSTNGIKLSRGEAAREGRFVSKLCREKGLEVQRVADMKYGELNAYPVEVLDEWLELYRQPVG